MEKDKVRKEFLARRKRMTPEERKKASKEISHFLSDYLEHTDLPVFFYYPQGTEVDVRPVMKQILAKGQVVGLPKVEGETLVFYAVQDLEQDLEEGAFHLQEPKCDCPPMIPDPGTICIVPGVGFDLRGNRLGHGKGYYDRFLAKYPKLITMGVAYRCQMTDQLPREEHDVALDYLVTEEGIKKVLNSK